MKPFLCFLLMSIFFTSTSFGQEESTAKTAYQNKGPVEYQKITRLDLSKYSFVKDDNTTDVTEFKIHVQGQASVLVKGAKMNQKAIQSIQKAKNDSRVIIFDIVRNGVSSEEGAIIFSLEK